MTTSKTFFLFDANSLVHRAFHALPPLTDRAGAPAQALYGVASILIKIFQSGPRPAYAAALFDRPEPTFREKKFPAYKAQRPPAPDGLISQIIDARELFAAFGIVPVEEPGAEADDLIATLVRVFSPRPDLKLEIFTGDLDSLQLVRSNVVARVFRTGVSETVAYDEAEVVKRYGLPPARLVDYKALVGDASDNIPGARGIGPKTAAHLLARYSSLEELYRHLGDDTVGSRVAGVLMASRDQVFLARELVSLEGRAAAGGRPLEDFVFVWRPDVARAYCDTRGFRSLEKRLDDSVPVASPLPPRPRRGRDEDQKTLF